MSRIAYTQHGELGRPALLFLHGFMGSRADWDVVLPAFLPEYCSLTIDLPGHGETPILPGDDFVQLAADLIEFIDELDVATFSVIGYSMGGRIALYLAVHYSMRIDAAVLESVSPGLEDVGERAARRAADDALAQRIKAQDFAAFLKDWYAQPIFNGPNRDEQHVADLIERRKKQEPEKLAQALSQFSTGRQPSLWNDLQSPLPPMLILAGEHDTKYRAIAQSMAARTHAARACIIPSAAHNAHFDNPSMWQETVLGFLSANI